MQKRVDKNIEDLMKYRLERSKKLKVIYEV